MVAIPVLGDNALEAICAVLADTNSGLTGSEIGTLLLRGGIADIAPEITKRKRLFEALRTRQSKDGCSNNVFAFIQSAMDPIRHTQASEYFESKRRELNVVLALQGYQIGEDGKVRKTDAVSTIADAEAKASSLHKKLADRRVHPYVLKFCRAELLQENYFHAVFEATKSIADRLREMTSQDKDGSALVDLVLAGDKPLLAINSLQTETERGEQAGFVNLLKGIFGMFRNTTAHIPKIKWQITEEDALELLTIVSFAHRKLDKAIRTGYPV